MNINSKRLIEDTSQRHLQLVRYILSQLIRILHKMVLCCFLPLSTHHNSLSCMMLTIGTRDTHSCMTLDLNIQLVLQVTQRQVVNAANIVHILCQTVPSLATLHLIILLQEQLDSLHGPICVTLDLKQGHEFLDIFPSHLSSTERHPYILLYDSVMQKGHARKQPGLSSAYEGIPIVF
jgi:hypothetical protein